MTSQLRLNDMLRVLTLGLVIVTQAQAEEGDSVGIQIDTKVQTYVQNYCVTCHGEDEQEGDRRLDILPTDFGNDDTVILYEEILDQLNLGEMPPNKKSVKQPKVEETAEVVESLTNLLESVTESKQKHVSVLRRLNRLEYKNTVSELLGVNTINVDPTKNFPSDERVHGFLNIGEAQVTSDVLMQHYLNAADKFIDKAVHFGPAPQTTKVLIEASQFETTTKRARSKVYWRLLKEDRVEIGHGYPERYVNYPSGYAKRGAPVDGYYKIRIKAAGLNRLNHPYEAKDFRKNFDLSQKMQLSLGIATDKVAIEGASRENRRIDSIFELNDNEPAVHEVVVWMDKGSIPYFNWRNGIGNPRGFINLVANKYHKENEQLIFNLNEANRLHLEPKSRQFKPKGKDLISEVYQGPRIAIYNVEVEGPIIDEWPPASHRKIFGEAKTPEEVNVAEMIQNFAQRAFRRPVKAEEVSHYVDFVKKVEAAGKSTEEALKQGLKAILVSPRFIYLAEGAEGELDDYQLASRLSYSLWSSMPDQELLDVAAEGKLKDPVVRREQTLRMLQDKRAQHFIKGFTDAWLRLDKLGSMPPDPRAYANYYNLHLEGAMRQETLLFINHFVEENLPVKTMLDADFTFLNWGLAKHYGVPDIDGLEMRKVTLPKRSRRNGLLGHGSILTLTANGVETSPIVRGIWILEKVLGTPPSPPPPDIEPLEPDLRGTTTVREQLQKHREVETCMNCHQKIDPLGFPLEAYDPIGRFRKGYATSKGKRLLKIDAYGELPSGESFEDERGLKALLVSREQQFARTIVVNLLTYTCGREVTYRDEKLIQGILEATKKDKFRLRDLITEVIGSQAFEEK